METMAVKPKNSCKVLGCWRDKKKKKAMLSVEQKMYSKRDSHIKVSRLKDKLHKDIVRMAVDEVNQGQR